MIWDRLPFPLHSFNFGPALPTKLFHFSQFTIERYNDQLLGRDSIDSKFHVRPDVSRSHIYEGQRPLVPDVTIISKNEVT